MKVRLLVAVSLFLFGFQPSMRSNPNRNWQTAQVQQIQRVFNVANPGDHWEYVLTSTGFVYTVRNGGHDSPYLNSSLGSEVKIASALSDSNHPFDGIRRPAPA
jgi:hypothetical protein